MTRRFASRNSNDNNTSKRNNNCNNNRNVLAHMVKDDTSPLPGWCEKQAGNLLVASSRMNHLPVFGFLRVPAGNL